MKTPRSGAISFALALLLSIGTTTICAAKTFVPLAEMGEHRVGGVA
jgi:hypothetical protein